MERSPKIGEQVQVYFFKKAKWVECVIKKVDGNGDIYVKSPLGSKWIRPGSNHLRLLNGKRSQTQEQPLPSRSSQRRLERFVTKYNAEDERGNKVKNEETASDKLKQKPPTPPRPPQRTLERFLKQCNAENERGNKVKNEETASDKFEQKPPTPPRPPQRTLQRFLKQHSAEDERGNEVKNEEKASDKLEEAKSIKDHVEMIRELFERYDFDNSGSVPSGKIVQVIEDMGLDSKTAEEVEKEIPLSSKGKICFEDFLAWHMKNYKHKYRMEKHGVKIIAGSKVEVYFRSKKKWIKGMITETDESAAGHFLSDDKHKFKWVHLYDEKTVRLIEPLTESKAVIEDNSTSIQSLNESKPVKEDDNTSIQSSNESKPVKEDDNNYRKSSNESKPVKEDDNTSIQSSNES
eukprot:g2084.t1